jgi:hypothetical protein
MKYLLLKPNVHYGTTYKTVLQSMGTIVNPLQEKEKCYLL